MHSKTICNLMRPKHKNLLREKIKIDITQVICPKSFYVLDLATFYSLQMNNELTRVEKNWAFRISNPLPYGFNSM